MYCKRCGSKLDDDANFCEKCGTMVDGAEQDTKKTVSDETAMFNEISDAIKAAEDEAPLISEEEIKEDAGKMPEDEISREESAAAEASINSEKTGDAAVIMKESEIKYKEDSKKRAEPGKSKEKIKDPEKDRKSYFEKGPEKQGSGLSYEIENAARKALGSFQILWGMLALGVQVAFMLVYSFSYRVDETLNFLGRLFFFQENADLYLRIAVVLAAVVEIIVLVGFMLTFISANRKKRSFKTSGLSILQALCVIGLIMTCFIGLCGIGAGLVGLRYLRHYTYISLEGVSTGQIIYVSCMAGCVLICYILALIFFAKLISSIGRAKRAAAEGRAKKNIALYNVVIIFAVAVFMVAFIIASLLTSAPSSWMIITGELAFCIACIMFALFMVKYRKGMKKVLKK